MRACMASAYASGNDDHSVLYHTRISYHTRMVHTIRVYGTYHTRMVRFCILYAYGTTIRVWYVPYAYGTYHTRSYIYNYYVQTCMIASRFEIEL